MRVDEVFGIAPQVRLASYVDRGLLDAELTRHLSRDTHIALRGESKCGKSWLRQKNIPDAIVVQCRLNKVVNDIYIDALSQLDVKLTVTSERGGSIKGSVSAKGEFGAALLGKLGVKTIVEAGKQSSFVLRYVGHDVEDLRFVAELIRTSGKRLVIEDFHYMTLGQRRQFAFDLKALWDYGLFVTIIGVWSQSNMLLFLNPDLSGRVHEMPIDWNPQDLRQVLEMGGGGTWHHVFNACYRAIVLIVF